MKKFLAFMLTIAIAAGIVAGCAGNAATDGEPQTEAPLSGEVPATSTQTEEPVVLRMLYDVENTSLNYLTGDALHSTACNMVDGLVEFDNHSNIIPGLAESWETSDDGLVWTFHIRKGVNWYDCAGNEIAEVTANDWVAGLEYVCTPKNNASTFSQVRIVKGAQPFYDALTAGQTADFADVGVRAVDDYTLEYTLERPTPYFLGGLAYVCWLPAYGPLLEATATEDGSIFGTSADNVYSCGAFILTEWEPQVRQTFVKNANNWDAGRVYIDRIEQTYNAEASSLAPTMILRDEIDFANISNDILDDWKADHSDYLSKSRDDSMWHYWYSFDFKPTYGDEYAPVDWMRCVLNNNFRHAIMSAFDREFIVQSAVEQENPNALIQNTITPAGSCYTDKGVDFADMPAFDGIENNYYNLDMAAQYKAAAIEELTAEGVTFPVTVVVSYQSSEKDYENECILVKQQLEKALGTDFINVELWAGPSENFLTETRSAGKYSFMRVRWGADYIDPQTWTDPFASTVDADTGVELGNTYNRWNILLDDDAFRTAMAGITDNSVPEHTEEYLASADFAEVRGILEQYYELVNEGVNEGVDLTKRFEKFAEAEALLINNAMLIPCYIGPAKYQATKLNVFEGSYAACGYSKLMYKGMHLEDHFISMEEYDANYKAWQENQY